MLPSGQAIDKAVTAPNRELFQSLTVDWNKDGQYNHELSDLSKYVVRSNRDQALTSTAPDELRLISGYASAKLEIELAGSYQDVPLTAHFSSQNPRSVFYGRDDLVGAEVLHQIGVGGYGQVEDFPQFIGYIRDIKVNRKTGIITISLLDQVERLRDTIRIPAYGIPIESYTADEIDGGSLYSSAIIDQAARSGGISNETPLGMTGDVTTVLSVPFHGSILPEIGDLDTVFTVHQTNAWEAAGLSPREPWLWSGNGETIRGLNGVPVGQEQHAKKHYWIDTSSIDYQLSGTWVIAFWLYFDDTNRSDYTVAEILNRGCSFSVEFSSGRITPVAVDENGNRSTGESMSLGFTGSWHYVEVGFQHSADLRTRTRVADTTGDIVTASSGYFPGSYNALTGLVRFRNYMGLSDVEMTYTSDGGALSDITKVLDTSRNETRISTSLNKPIYTVRREGEAWEIAKELAAAEFGAVFFDEQGHFCFFTQDDIKAKHSEVVRRFTPDEVEGFSYKVSLDMVRNKWSYQTRVAYSATSNVYDYTNAETPLTLNGGKYKPSDLVANPNDWTIYLIEPKETLICPDPYSIPITDPSAKWNQYIPMWGRSPYDSNGNFVGGDGNDYRTEQKWFDRFVQMSLYNSTSGSVTYKNPDGENRFRLRGTEVYEYSATDNTSEDSESQRKYGTRSITQDSFWLQEPERTKKILEPIMSKFTKPIPVTDPITVPGDPRVQIGDVISVSDPDGIGPDIKLQIFGIKREMASDVGLKDRYQVEIIEPQTYGVWNDPSYGIWNQSFVWGP